MSETETSSSAQLLEEPDQQLQTEPELSGVAPSPPIRVAWVASADTFNILGRTYQPLAVGLLDENVHLVTVCGENVNVAQLPSPPMEIIRHGRLRYGPLHTKAEADLVDELRARKIDLLHALDASALCLTRRLAKMLNRRYAASCFRFEECKLLCSLDSRASAVLAATESLRDELVRRGAAKARQIHLVRPGVYQVRHATCFTRPDCAVSIIAGGDLGDVAAFSAVVRALAELRNRDCPCILFILGSGSGEKRLRELADTLHVRNETTFVDRQPAWQLPEILRAADIYIAPVPDKGLDMQALLAMAAGVTVVAAQGAGSDFLIDSKTALLFKPGDAKALTERLASLLDRRAEARTLSEQALDYLRRHHSAAGMVSAVTQVYRGAVV